MQSIADPYFRKALDQFLSRQTRSDKIQVRLAPSAVPSEGHTRD